MPRGVGGAPGGDFDMDLGNMTDFFESIFGSMFSGGGRQRREQGRPGRDLQYELSLTLEQVVQGAPLRISIPRPVRCGDCGGSGAAAGTRPKTCPQCQGRGQIRLQQGIFSMSAPCAMCGARGQVIATPCGPCGGTGLVEKQEEFAVDVPPGVENGAVKVISGAGEQGRDGGRDGNLNILIRVEKHAHFERDGNDLRSSISVTYPQAVLGDEIDVPTIDGPVKMKIRPGTASGQVYALRGKGVPFLRGNARGDLKVAVEVDIPRNLTPRQKELGESLGKELGTAVQARPASLLEKMKSLFE
jgi:molecular chaperone DnaJ